MKAFEHEYIVDSIKQCIFACCVSFTLIGFSCGSCISIMLFILFQWPDAVRYTAIMMSVACIVLLISNWNAKRRMGELIKRLDEVEQSGDEVNE